MEQCLGAVLGALIGDSIGSKLEFLGKVPTTDQVEQAMLMPGGGHWGVSPGQVTDDGEETVSLLRGLLQMEQSQTTTEEDRTTAVFHADFLAASYMYARWVESKPFDMGNATNAAFGFTAKCAHVTADKMMAKAQVNLRSKANGSLMRCTPLALVVAAYWRDHPDQDPEQLLRVAFAVAKMDCSLSHPNPSVVLCVAVYVSAVAHLISVPLDGDGALNIARSMLRYHSIVVTRNGKDKAEVAAGIEVSTWLADVVEGNMLQPILRPRRLRQDRVSTSFFAPHEEIRLPSRRYGNDFWRGRLRHQLVHRWGHDRRAAWDIQNSSYFFGESSLMHNKREISPPAPCVCCTGTKLSC